MVVQPCRAFAEVTSEIEIYKEILVKQYDHVPLKQNETNTNFYFTSCSNFLWENVCISKIDSLHYTWKGRYTWKIPLELSQIYFISK